MTKEEIIKQAYGEYYEDTKLCIDNNGFCQYGSKDDSDWGIEPFGEYETRNHIDGIYEWRPKSLQGIENNNGWIKIENEKDLPDDLYCEVIERRTQHVSRATLEKRKSCVLNYSHWQPIQKLEPPIY